MVLTKTEQPSEDLLASIPQRSQDETLAAFDAQARRVLGISGAEFLRRLDAGDLDDVIDDPVAYPGITYLMMLSDSVR